MAKNETTVEWFGATTYRLKTHGITVFLDTWLDRPSSIPQYLSTSDVTECDYIFISHAHFDHLPGADIIAKNTGAIIVANCEAVQVMRDAGVPDAQLIPIAGGERIPLFTAAQRQAAIAKAAAEVRPEGPPRPGQGTPGPPFPEASEAQLWVHPWPSLHALMPSFPNHQFPETLDSGTVYTGSALNACTLDVTRGLKYGLGGLIARPELPPQLQGEMRTFVEYMRQKDVKYSYCDGGQIMYNFLIGSKVLLYSAHLGGYEGILKHLEPKPDVAIMAIAGRPNHNGRPFDGSAAQYAKMKLGWLGEPKKVIWCLHDKGAMNPKYIDTKAATETVNNETGSKVWDLEPTNVYKIFE